MEVRKSIIKVNAQNYKKASKKEKSGILNDLEKITNQNRKYLITLLNNTGKIYYILRL